MILISGINGYIASNIGLDLLRRGYTVRGTSRSTPAKDDLLAGAFQGFESRYVGALRNLLHLRFQEPTNRLMGAQWGCTACRITPSTFHTAHLKYPDHSR